MAEATSYQSDHTLLGFNSAGCCSLTQAISSVALTHFSLSPCVTLKWLLFFLFSVHASTMSELLLCDLFLLEKMAVPGISHYLSVEAGDARGGTNCAERGVGQ